MKTKYAGVYLLDVPFNIDRQYDYLIPDTMDVEAGDFVGVPFGNGNRHLLALVSEVRDTTKTPKDKVKPLLSVCGRELSLSRELLDIWQFLRSQTLCTTSDAIHAMIPSAAMSRLEEHYVPTGKTPSASLSEDTQAMMIYNHIVARGRIGEDALRYRFSSNMRAPLDKLIRLGYVARELELKAPRDKTESYYAIALPAEELQIYLDGGSVDGKKIQKLRSETQRQALLTFMEEKRAISSTELESFSITKATVSALIKKGLLTESRTPIMRDLATIIEASEGEGSQADVVLSDEQAQAYDALLSLFESGEPKAALLEGVTGSGKTSVMLAIIDRVLEGGRDVILLLPEIALTPQTLAIFSSRYQSSVAVLHSAMSAGERQDSYNRIKRGEAHLVIGTRSAVFAPVCKLGLIIIDEEQEHTYKSDTSPRYHARDIARFRCAKTSSLLLLASATPSIESRKKAADGAYTLLRLTKRYGKATLPEVIVADMRAEPRTGNLTPIGKTLSRLLTETFERGEQSVLFLNRRGYNNYVSCASCGEAVKCPSCSVSMTYHTKRGDYENGVLVCHWCGRRMPLPKSCPSCSSEHLIRMGYGTQRVEQELSILLPTARILRMDTDTTQNKASYRELLGKFRRHEADILLGTQMVTKGHDFPDVTLVGILLADASLYFDDYRAEERTFAMLTQVIGRAGRRERPGRAVIQTNNPDHEVIELARAQDYETLYSRVVRLRRALTFPPFCDIALLTVTSPNERDCALVANELNQRLQALAGEDRYKDLPFIFFGPFEAPVYRVDGKYRMRIIIKCRLCADTRRLIATILSEFSPKSSSSPLLTVDFNPTSI